MALRPASRCCWRARANRANSELFPRWLRSRFCGHLDGAELHVGAWPPPTAACPAAAPAAAPPPAIAASPGRLRLVVGRVRGVGRAAPWRSRPRHDAPRVEHAAGPVDGRGQRPARSVVNCWQRAGDGSRRRRPRTGGPAGSRSGAARARRRARRARPCCVERHRRASVTSVGWRGASARGRRGGRAGAARRRRGRALDEPERHDGRSGLPSSRTSISSGRRSLTVRPFLSRATTSSTTAWVPDGKTGAASGFGGGWGDAASAVAERTTARSIATSSAAPPAATSRHPRSASPPGRRRRTSRAVLSPPPCRSC